MIITRNKVLNSINADFILNELENNKDIIARDKFIEQIYQEFDNVLKGNLALNIIKGSAGVGKTYLVKKTHDFFISNGCFYINVKFKQYNKDVLTAVIDIIDEIVKYIFTLPNDDFNLVQNNIKKSFSSDSEVITSLCPYAVKLFDKRNVIKTKNIDIKENRIIEVVYQFIKAASEVLFPLVIFIDDLQWADKLSLDIIKYICNKDNESNMHLILAYRDNEVSVVNGYIFSENKDKIIYLTDLNRIDTFEYIVSTFGENIKSINYFADILYSLSRGNPFYLKLITNDIINRNILFKDKNDRWVLDSKQLRKLEISKDIKDLIIKQIESLNDNDRRIIELISCFGGSIKYNTLKTLVNTSNEKFDIQLSKLTKESLLIKEKNNYSFVHDIIYKIIHQRQNKKQQLEMYYYIAKTLLEYNKGEYAKNNCLFIATFLLKVNRIMLVEDKMKWIHLLYKAAMIARYRTAFDISLKLFSICNYLISLDESCISRDLFLNIQLEYMQCQFISGSELEAKERYHKLINRFNDKDSLIKIKLKYIYFYSYSANWEKVISLGIEILNNLNFLFDTRFIYLDLLKSKLLYSTKSIEKIKDAPVITDNRILTIMEVLTIMFPAANRIDYKKFTLITLKLAMLAKKYGKSLYSCIGYASYVYVLFFVFKDYQKGNRLQQITLDLLNDKDYITQKSIPYALIGTFTYHWSNSFSSTIECLNKSIELGEVEDEYLFSNYAVVFTIITKYVMGEQLSSIVSYINCSKSKKKRLENYLTRHMYEIYLSHISLLKNGYDNNGYSIDESKKSFSDTIILNAKMLKLHRLYLEGKLEDAFKLANEIYNLVWNHQGFVLNGDFAFYSTLSRIAIHNNLTKKERKLNKVVIDRDMKELKKWVGVYKNNHYVRYLLAQAEYDHHILKIRREADYYNKAITFAKSEKNIQLEALANLLASKYYIDNHKLTGFYAKESSRLYQRWGADYIAKKIYPVIVNEINAKNVIQPIQLETKEINDINIINYLSKASEMSEDEIYSYILDYVVEKYSIKYCAILYEKNGEMFIKYEKKYSEELKAYKKPVNIKFINSLSHRVIRYVSRTELEVVIINNNMMDFLGNDLLTLDSDNRSVMCFPLKQYGVLTGIVYLHSCDSKESNKNIIGIIKWLISLIPQLETDFYQDKTKKANIKLTSRESQILSLIGLGMSNNEISEKLFISVGTVRNHLSKVYTKLNVDNRVKAIIKAKEENLI